MELSKGTLVLLLAIGLVTGFVVLKPNEAKQVLGNSRELLSRLWASADAALQHPAPGTAEATPEPLAGATPVPAGLAQAESEVESYMQRNAAPQATLSYLDWSDFAVAGPLTAITLRYSVQQPSHDDIVAAVRFTLRGESVVNAVNMTVISPIPEEPLAPAPTPPPVVQQERLPEVRLAATPLPPVVDHFSGHLMDVLSSGESMTPQLSDAFSLGDLDQAKRRAQQERKPLGFILVWGQYFGKSASPRGNDGPSALVHFYEVFHDELVLVYVRHETEIGIVPPAVSKGFSGPDEGGYAPTMAVTDATATEFIVQIPYRDLDEAGRNEIFVSGGKKIDQWLSTHPDAVATPTPTAQ
jgi:hypothetical protein